MDSLLRIFCVLLLPLVGCSKSATWSFQNGATFSVDTSLDFGTQTVLHETDKTITLSNLGSTPWIGLGAGTPALTTPFVYQGGTPFTAGTFPGTTGTCGTTLAAGASCTIALSFIPTAGRSFGGSLVLTYDDGSAKTTTLALSGTGTGSIPVYEYQLNNGGTTDYVDTLESSYDPADTGPGTLVKSFGIIFYAAPANPFCLNPFIAAFIREAPTPTLSPAPLVAKPLPPTAAKLSAFFARLRRPCRE